LLAVILVAAAGTVWAANSPAATGNKGELFRQAWEQVKARLETMRQNRENAQDFKGHATQIATQIRAEVKRIRDGGLPLAQEQLEQIRAQIAAAKGYGLSIKETLGQIGEACVQAREARRNSEAGPVKGAYTTAEAVQTTRLTHLQNLTATLNEILTQLKAIQ
jgi:hypothetical protein